MTSGGPLADLTVVELAYYRAGPFCCTLLADMGADVVKVEPPGTGDPNRTLGPGPDERSGTFMALNRNKRSVTLDLKSDAGHEAALELIEDADVVVDELGVDFQVDNVEGASGMRGVGQGVRADPDGYTMTALNPPFEMITALVQEPDFDMTTMEPVCTYGAVS
jgi:hypothetical protein